MEVSSGLDTIISLLEEAAEVVAGASAFIASNDSSFGAVLALALVLVEVAVVVVAGEVRVKGEGLFSLVSDKEEVVWSSMAAAWPCGASLFFLPKKPMALLAMAG
jgi:hypothetical protein